MCNLNEQLILPSIVSQAITAVTAADMAPVSHCHLMLISRTTVEGLADCAFSGWKTTGPIINTQILMSLGK